MSFVEIGKLQTLKVDRLTKIGIYFDDGADGILLPKRYVPLNCKPGDELEVFVYHDSEDRVIATTDKPLAQVGDIAVLKVVHNTHHGAFLDWGLMKDLFVPKSQQISFMRIGAEYLVKIYIDERTGRVSATEKIEQFLTNKELSVKEGDEVELMVYRKTQIGFMMIINNQHLGLLHNNEMFKDLVIGQKHKGFIKKILEDNKIDVLLGAKGYSKVNTELEHIVNLLNEHNGYLPYNDKSAPEDIYSFFGMSKKTFKMTTGKLFKDRVITFTQTGIQLINES